MCPFVAPQGPVSTMSCDRLCGLFHPSKINRCRFKYTGFLPLRVYTPEDLTI